MQIKKLPHAVKNVYSGQQSQWCKNLKNVSSGKLATSLDKIIDQAKAVDSVAWLFSSVVLNELQARDYAKNHLKKMDEMREAIKKKSGLCLVDPKYALEVGGVPKQILSPHAGDKKVMHPYPYSESGRKINDKWGDSQSGKPMDKYISYFSKETKKDLKKHSVVYLKPTEQRKFLVSFTSDGQIKIGGKSPKNGSYIFALSHDGTKLLAGKKQKGQFQHTSFFSGQAFQCAGNLILKDKKISQIRLSSGHYKPTREHGEHVRQYLANDKHLSQDQIDKIKIRAYDQPSYGQVLSFLS